MTPAEVITITAAVIALGCVLAAAIADIRRFEIPDGLSIALVATAIVYGLATPGFVWWSHIAAPLGFFALGLFVFSRGWMGGGDIKLMTGIAAWTGLEGLLAQFVATALAGGILALALIVARRVLASPALASRAFASRRAGMPRVFQSDAPLPYAIAIAAGTFWWAAKAWPIA
ncbi:hypothetical protein GCM10011529_16940 [Polymorphobacter glacialis]|uniref:Prepilin type IV endopeptidase peptidase domain-containing protein n=1 Tax=Sandarakinorhabdus glacialis TaxID=1614636 RepID=A0A917E7J5_9SPHN|nr:prepilin peptidase [Polymorphobacter glacialis]GGE11188.1 hypothetical protein GCM10011529_16940 [Polymorphobacter glacialis]